MKEKKNNPIQPVNFVGRIPHFICGFLAFIILLGLFHIYGNGQKVFDSTLHSERQKLSTQVSVDGELQISKYKFVKNIWARNEKTEKENGEKKFLLWESLPDFNAKISKDIEVLSCENKKGDDWSKEKTEKTNAWCSLIGTTPQAIDAKNGKNRIRQIVNKSDEIEIKDKNGNPTGKYYDYDGNKELFDLPPYDFWKGIQKFPDNEISKNGEYTLSIYPSVQEGMYEFMSKHNMTGSVFAYRPSNGDIYCMASTPGWTEREKKMVVKKGVYKEIPGQPGFYYPEREKMEVPKDGSQMNKNFYSFTPGSTMKPLTLLLLKDQGIDLNSLKFSVTHEDSGYGGDSHVLKDGTAAHCSANHSQKEQSASDGLGNSCNSFFAMSAEKLNLKTAKETLEAMDFYVEEYTGDPRETRTDALKYASAVDKIPYTKNALPLEKTMTHSFRNVENFIGEGSLLVSPIDMAVLAALFGKLSEDINSRVYFPRIWLPVDENKQNEGSPELLLTEKNPAGNEHVAKLSDFVSTRKESIAEVGTIWKKAFKEHYRHNNQTWPARKHLDQNKLTDWSQWIDMAKTGTVNRRPDKTDPSYGCHKYKYHKDKGYQCATAPNKAEHRKQRTLSLYSEELDLAAYIVIENYGGVSAGNSEIKLDSTSLMLTRLVAEALGKKLNSEQQAIEDEQWDRFNGRAVKQQQFRQQLKKAPAKQKGSKTQNNKKQQPKKVPAKQKGKSKKR